MIAAGEHDGSDFFALIPGPVGGERLFTIQLHVCGLRTIGLARM